MSDVKQEVKEEVAKVPEVEPGKASDTTANEVETYKQQLDILKSELEKTKANLSKARKGEQKADSYEAIVKGMMDELSANLDDDEKDFAQDLPLEKKWAFLNKFGKKKQPTMSDDRFSQLMAKVDNQILQSKPKEEPLKLGVSAMIAGEEKRLNRGLTSQELASIITKYNKGK